ncbi:MAG TPA: hypothetical protein VFL17_00150, partial [Anaerolineae bacterium]|nr:hypothetical protein [Anaerolineae bacterium]
MSFAAKSAIPNDADAALRQPVLEQAAEGGMTLFTAPAGYLLTGSLAAVLDGHGRSMLWLRLGPEDRDPAVLLMSLIASAQHIRPGLGTDTVSQMRRLPGPIQGWPHLFEHLGRELNEALPTSSAIVLEHVHYLNDVQPTLALLGHYILSALPSNVVCILASHNPLPPATLPVRTAYRGVNDLRLADHAALGLLESAEAKLPSALVYRANTLVGGRAGVLADLFSAVALHGRASVQQAVERATSLEDLLTRVARAWLTTVNAETLQAIALATRLEFSHPALIQAAIGVATTPAGPWLQPLADNWKRVRRVWLGPLRASSRAESTLSGDMLRRAADYL